MSMLGYLPSQARSLTEPPTLPKVLHNSSGTLAQPTGTKHALRGQGRQCQRGRRRTGSPGPLERSYWA
eukprot:11796671-Alexandrium_andersonii.AAC.1